MESGYPDAKTTKAAVTVRNSVDFQQRPSEEDHCQHLAIYEGNEFHVIRSMQHEAVLETLLHAETKGNKSSAWTSFGAEEAGTASPQVPDYPTQSHSPNVT